MKRFSFELDEYQLNNLSITFREKKNVISFWMQVAKTVMSFVQPKSEYVAGRMLIHISKMRRVFIEGNGKAFSTALPFSVKEVDGIYRCSLRSGLELNSRLSSEVLAVLQTTKSFENLELLGFTEDVMEVSEDPDALWAALGELISSDDGYIRIDHDPDREDGALHPLNHIDVFVSQSATFKLGLTNKLEIEAVSDLLDLSTDCHYLSKN